MPRHITLNTKMSAKFSMSEPQCTYDGQELETQGVDHLISEELLVERSRAFIAANLHQDKMLRFFLGVFFFFSATCHAWCLGSEMSEISMQTPPLDMVGMFPFRFLERKRTWFK